MSYFRYMIIIILALTFSNTSAEISNFEKGKNFFDKNFAMFSGSFRKFFEVIVAPETCCDLFGLIRIHSDTFGYMWKRSETFERFRNFSGFFNIFGRIISSSNITTEISIHICSCNMNDIGMTNPMMIMAPHTVLPIHRYHSCCSCRCGCNKQCLCCCRKVILIVIL